MDRSSAHNTRHPELHTALRLAGELPPMDLPEETEPEHRGTFFGTPVEFDPPRAIGKHDHWIMRGIIVAILALCALMVFLSTRSAVV